MGRILSIAKYTIIEQIRNRLYLVIVFFGALILISSVLVGKLAPSHRVKVIFDLGLVSIELLGLITAVFGAVTLVLQEIEQKTIYLILTRPVSRMTYLLGRFSGLVAAVAITMGIMGLVHIATMIYNPFEFGIFQDTYDFWGTYPVLFLMSVGKMLITTALALFFSLFATSSVSALVFSGFFWIAGHFGTELEFMLENSFSGGAAVFLKVLSYLIPNYQYFNLRDTFSFVSVSDMGALGWPWVYALAYTAFFLALSGFLFSRKEF